MKNYLRILIFICIAAGFLFACTSGDDDDDNDNNDDTGDDDDDDDITIDDSFCDNWSGVQDWPDGVPSWPDDLSSCGDYQEYPGWFQLDGDIYDFAVDYSLLFFSDITLCVAHLEGKRLEVEGPEWGFSADWIAEEGGFSVEDGQEVYAYASWWDGDLGTAALWLMDKDLSIILFQTNAGFVSPELPEGMSLHSENIPLNCKYTDDQELPPLQGDEWYVVGNNGICGEINGARFAIPGPGETVLASNGWLQMQLLYFYTGDYYHIAEKNGDQDGWRRKGRMNLQAVAVTE